MSHHPPKSTRSTNTARQRSDMVRPETPPETSADTSPADEVSPAVPRSETSERGAHRNSAGLLQYARHKQEDTRRRVDQALQEVVSRQEPASFHRIAALAGVSRSYLYSEPDIRSRIEALRQREDLHPANMDARQTRSHASQRSDAGKDVLLVAKERRIHALEAENRRLKEELRVALGKLYAQT